MAKRIPQKIKNEVNEYLRILRRDGLPIEKALIFGSYAIGKADEESDIDLCVISQKFNNAFWATQYLWKKLPYKRNKIEPVGFNPKDFAEGGSLIEEIKKFGVKV